MENGGGDKLVYWASRKLNLGNYESLDLGASETRTLTPEQAADPAVREKLWTTIIEEVEGVLRAREKRVKEKMK